MDTFTETAVQRYLPPHLRELPLLIQETVPSTNTLAREMGEAGAAHGTVVAAAAQTAGRGRRGRSFHSPDGTGLYFSILLRPDMDASRAVRITTAAAVALCRALGSLGVLDTSIKWVNDVFRGGRKIAGILTEAAFAEGGRMRCAVLGVGVNVTPPRGGFPPELADIAGAALDAPLPDARARLLAAFLTEFFALYGHIAEPAAAHMDEYRRRCFLIGRDVTVLAGAGEHAYPAHVLGIDEECRLLLRLADGSRTTLGAGEVSVRI